MSDRVSFGPAPSWVNPAGWDADAKATQGEPTTQLLLDQQINAETGERYTHSVERLETMEAVQHLSQWRLRFDPVTQTVVVHTLTVRRGDQSVEHARPEKARVLQREEGLEAFVLEGSQSLLVLLEDVRVGDVIEGSFTVTTRPRLMAETVTAFFGRSDAVTVMSHHAAVRFREGRPLRWKASAAAGEPVVETVDGETIWRWKGGRTEARRAESQVPAWWPADYWVQVSDVPDWGAVAKAIAAAWYRDDESPLVEEQARKIEAATTNLVDRAEAAIRWVQDEFRYLSVNLELGGQVPTLFDEVIRRRYGDCKDLSFLLTLLLRRLGVTARPLLVQSGELKPEEAELLPSMTLFNHAIVELTLEGKTRRVDATRRRQGGGVFGRPVNRFGLALPVDAEATALVDEPEWDPKRDRHETTETVLLDTTGGASVLRVTTCATGLHADMYRLHFENTGLDKFSRDRLQLQADRYAHAEEDSPLVYEDDRDANVWRMVEIYKISRFINLTREPGRCEIALPVGWPMPVLERPELGERRAPFALPYPFNVVHTFEVISRALTQLPATSRSFTSEQLGLTMKRRCGVGRWSQETVLETRADHVPAEAVAEHRKLVEAIWAECGWSLLVPKGVPRMRRGANFDQLPVVRDRDLRAPVKPVRRPTTDRKSSEVAAATAVTAKAKREARAGDVATKSGSTTSTPASATAGGAADVFEKRKTGRRRRKRSKKRVWVLLVVIALVVGAALVAGGYWFLKALRG